MNIILEENILPLKKFVNSSNKVERTNEYRNYLHLKFQKIIKGIGLDDSLINEIKVIPYSKELGNFGETKTIIINNTLKFNIIFPDIIIFWNDDVKQERFDYALAIIFHEFYHCSILIYHKTDL